LCAGQGWEQNFVQSPYPQFHGDEKMGAKAIGYDVHDQRVGVTLFGGSLYANQQSRNYAYPVPCV
jgi:hypothetical protein